MWTAAILLHGAAALALLFAPLGEHPPPPEPEPLLVTLLFREAEPPAAPPLPQAAAEPEIAPASEASSASSAATPEPQTFDVTPRAPDAGALELLDTREAEKMVPELPDAVRQALGRVLGCTLEPDAETDRAPDCRPPERILARAGGPDAGDFLDGDAIRLRGVGAAVATTAKFISDHVVDETIFDGRGGEGWVFESSFATYGKANPLLVDERIFDPETGEVVISRRPAGR